MFDKIGLAISFSPTGKALLSEAARLKNLFNSQLVLIHIGDKTDANESLLFSMVEETGINKNGVQIIWDNGDPATAIIKHGEESQIDLLIAGALEKERMLKFYFGSVARKIMREFHASSLILKSPSLTPHPFKKFIVSGDYSARGEKTIRSAFNFALKEGAEEFTIVRDFYIPGLTSTIAENKSPLELKDVVDELKGEEEEKMQLFVKELALKRMEVSITCIYGKEGWEESNYARSHQADIFAVPGPERKTRFIDKLFPHDVEYAFEKLPSNLLIIR